MNLEANFIFKMSKVLNSGELLLSNSNPTWNSSELELVLVGVDFVFQCHKKRKKNNNKNPHLIFWDQNFFETQNFLGLKFFLRPKFSLDQIFFGDKFFGHIFFWDPIFFYVFIIHNFSVLKIFQTQILLGPQFFF